jgi:hypothetical protein
MSFALGNSTAYIGVPFTLLVSYWLVLPRLSRRSSYYYLFLLAWGVPYVIGNICDTQKVGPRWAQWHLLDISYVPWTTTLGVCLYAVTMKLAGRTYDKHSIFKATAWSFAVFAAMAYVYEMAQSWQAWQEFRQTIDWSDYSFYAVGMTISVLPFIAFSRLRAAAYAQLS